MFNIRAHMFEPYIWNGTRGEGGVGWEYIQVQ